MSARFIDLDRQTPMLLPCDLRAWLPEDHLVHFILDAVEQMPLTQFHVNHRGTGSEQYPPAMMLALLIYCYATGRFGSRTIEAATHSDVAVRYLCVNTHPDHDSICTFRTRNETAFRAAFVTVLQLAQQLRLTKVGTVSVDGTKIQANASKHAAVSYQRAGEMIAQLELEVNQLLERARQAEAQEGQEPLDIPAELKRRESRKAALQQARQIIEERAKETAVARQADYQAKQAARQAQREAGKRPRGPEPTPPGAQPDPKAQYNFTDPASRIMKAGNGNHFEQAYNAQAAVDEAMLIVGQRVSAAPNDKEELAPTVAVISPVVAADVKVVLTDSGFYSEAATAAVEQNADGTASGITVYAAVEKHSHHKTVEDLLPQAEPAVPGPAASAKEKMAHRLKTAAGKALYKLRKQTVEPVFGIIKEVMGFRRFLLRGLAKVSLEWTLVCVSYNLKRLFTLKNPALAG
ncbi:MAG TPA: IS1182 family transposase [Verrucomicrobiae bacterium]